MKKKISKCARLAALGLVLAWTSGNVHAQTVATNTFYTFDTSIDYLFPSWAGQGSASMWDTPDANGNPNSGSLYMVEYLPGGSQLIGFSCFSGNPYYPYVYSSAAGSNVLDYVDLTPYTNVSMDILWDTNNSSIGINDFNNETFAGGNGTYGLEVDLITTANQTWTYLATIQIPRAASNGWAHVNIPIPTGLPVSQTVGFVFKKYTGSGFSGEAAFWIDNIAAEKSATPAAPPAISPLATLTPGLNIFANTTGLYDRESAELVQSNGLSWVGQATAAHPVTYSFTINGFPADAATAYGIQSYIFLTPNPAYNDAAPDYNEPSCIAVSIQRRANDALMSFQYKVGEPYGNGMYYGNAPYTNAPGSWDGVTANYYESGKLGTVTNPTPIGTWAIKFTSDTNVTLIAPGGTTSSFIMPPYNASQFAEVNPKGFSIYLGMQANNTASLNKAIVYSNFAITGTASPYSENFLADTVLNTTNIWNTGVAAAPGGVFVAPASAAYWLKWSLPDSGFGLQASTSLAAGSWLSLTNDSRFLLGGLRWQLVTTNDLPAGNSAFFRLSK